MADPDRASTETGETREASPASTTSTLTQLADNVLDDKSSSTPPTSIGDFAESYSHIDKQESPALTMAEQPLADTPLGAGASRDMPPPPIPATPSTPANPTSSARRSTRNRDTDVNYDVNAKIRSASGHRKRGPPSFLEAVKTEVDNVAARRGSMTNIPAFSDNTNDTPAQASASRQAETPDTPDSSLLDAEMVAQRSSEAQGNADAEGSSGSGKKALSSAKEQDRIRIDIERSIAKVAKAQKILEKANAEVMKNQLRLEMFKDAETPLKTTAPTPSPAKLRREVKRLEDTKEFKRIEEGVVIVEEIWSKGKKVVPGQPQPTKKNKKASTEETTKTEEIDAPVEAPVSNKVEEKFAYREAGLYAGGEYVDPFWTVKERSAAKKSGGFQARSLLPLPMGPAGYDMRSKVRDFVLPWAVCNPIVGRGHEKPPKHALLSKNRLVGEAAKLWEPPSKDNEMSPCQCKPEDACGENCTNRIMNYDCSNENCPIGEKLCTNRQFADLAERTSKGGPFNIGVNVVKTDATGFGVRSNRYFQAGQIIIEYCGEIITTEECERRMNEVYKDHPCYYLMAFDQRMIIDAGEKGSIARFVNHSCDPNCEMKKIFVRGEPRMALFAVKEVTTGQELTYDYNFHTFSNLSKQVCHCGAKNCRGFLMPKNNNDRRKNSQTLAGGVSQAVRGAAQVVAKTAKEAANGLKAAGKDLKRKVMSVLDDEDDVEVESDASRKKRKVGAAKAEPKKAYLGGAAKGRKETLRSDLFGANRKSVPDDEDEAEIDSDAARKKSKTSDAKSVPKKAGSGLGGSRRPGTLRSDLFGNGENVPEAAAGRNPKLNNSRAFLDGGKTTGTTGELKQTKLTFYSSSSRSSGANNANAPSAFAQPQPQPVKSNKANKDEGKDLEMKDAEFFVSESEVESEMDEDDLESFDAAYTVNTIMSVRPGARKPLPSAAPVSAQGMGGNRLRLIVNPSPNSSNPVSGQSSRNASPGLPVLSAQDELAASRHPRCRMLVNKTPFVLPPAPTPGGPPVPKRIRKHKSKKKAKDQKAKDQ